MEEWQKHIIKDAIPFGCKCDIDSWGYYPNEVCGKFIFLQDYLLLGPSIINKTVNEQCEEYQKPHRLVCGHDRECHAS